MAGRTAVPWDPDFAPDFLRLVIALTAQGFYGDPADGGNPDAVSWRMTGYHVLPPGVTWPPVNLPAPPLTSWDAVADHYDAIVVGAGAGGGVAACVLAEAGLRVLLVERGAWLGTHDIPQDHLHNHRIALGYDYPAGPASAGNLRVVGDETEAVPPTDGRWQNNAMTVGGGTRVYGAQAWRFCPEDFRMASLYGVPAGSALADWPLTYADLEPDYDRAEWEIGVSGDPTGNRHAGPRRRGYPMPPLPATATSATLARGAEALGLETAPGAVAYQLSALQRPRRLPALWCLCWLRLPRRVQERHA